MSAGIKANVDGSAAIQVGGTDVITLTSGGAATFVTSPTTVQAGTAAAPSITTSGDTNTGIFFPAADTIAFAEGGVESMRIDSAGNVGIGIAADERLTVSINNPTDGRVASLRNNGTSSLTGTKLWFNQNTVDNWNIGQPAGVNAFVFCNSTGSTNERARITSGGAFCVGTATNADANFQATFYSASNGGISLQNSTNYSAISATGNDVYLDVGKGGTAGTFHIRTGSLLSFRFQISGAGVMTCAGIYNTTVGATNRDVFVDNAGVVGYVSSVRSSKTNIQDLSDTSWLHQLNPVSFNYRKKDEEGSYTDETDGNIQYGLIAEDVEQVRPDLCFYDDVDGEQELRGIQYSKLVPVMLKEIQKLRAELDALKGAA